MGLYKELLAGIGILGNWLKGKKVRTPNETLGIGMQQGAQIQVQKKHGGENPPQNSWKECVEAP